MTEITNRINKLTKANCKSLTALKENRNTHLQQPHEFGQSAVGERNFLIDLNNFPQTRIERRTFCISFFCGNHLTMLSLLCNVRGTDICMTHAAFNLGVFCGTVYLCYGI